MGDKKKETPKARANREEIEREHLRQQFAGLNGILAGPPAELLFELMWFHAREDKPSGGRCSTAQAASDELIEDSTVWADCCPDRPALRSLLARTHRHPEQETKLREGDKVKARGELGETSCRLAEILRLNPSPKPCHPVRKLEHPDHSISSQADPTITMRCAKPCAAWSVRPDGCGRYRQSRPAKTAPEGQGRAAGSPLISEDDIVEATIDAKVTARPRHAANPRPTGDGKTGVSSHAILALIRRGKRVA
jgi:uncharacterized protein